ncbi:3372_t:CDS:2, partial [Funneliformis geosporum]
SSLVISMKKNTLRIKTVESSKIDHKVLLCKASADIISERSRKKYVQ